VLKGIRNPVDRARSVCGVGGRTVVQTMTDGCNPTDDSANCCSWAQSGECEANPGFMLASCKHACGQCYTNAPPSCVKDAPPGTYTCDAVRTPVSDPCALGSVRRSLRTPRRLTCARTRPPDVGSGGDCTRKWLRPRPPCWRGLPRARHSIRRRLRTSTEARCAEAGRRLPPPWRAEMRCVRARVRETDATVRPTVYATLYAD